MRINREIILAGVVLGTAVGQIPPTRLEFEVASVRPAEGLVAGRAASGGMRVDGAQVHLNSYLLKSLIAMAYNLKLYQAIHPDVLSPFRSCGGDLAAHRSGMGVMRPR